MVMGRELRRGHRRPQTLTPWTPSEPGIESMAAGSRIWGLSVTTCT